MKALVNLTHEEPIAPAIVETIDIVVIIWRDGRGGREEEAESVK